MRTKKRMLLIASLFVGVAIFVVLQLMLNATHSEERAAAVSVERASSTDSQAPEHALRPDLSEKSRATTTSVARSDADWRTYYNTKHRFSFSTPQDVVVENFGLPPDKVSTLSVMIVPDGDPASVCVMDNSDNVTARQLSAQWMKERPAKTLPSFFCGGTWPDVHIEEEELVVAGYRAHKVTLIHGELSEGPTVDTICTYFAERIAMVVCTPGYRSYSEQQVSVTGAYQRLLRSMRIDP